MNTIPRVKVPTFDLSVPVTGETIVFRPFVVKEEKMLIMAGESEGHTDMMNAVRDIVSACTNNAVDVDTAPLFVVQYVFLHIRGKSIGETIDYSLICGNCQHQTPMVIHIDEFKVHETPGHKDIIEIGGVTVKLRWFNWKNFVAFHEAKTTDDVLQIVAECITSISSDEEVFHNDGTNLDEVMEFLNGLLPEQYDQIQEFFDTMPMIRHQIKYTCENCGKEHALFIDGISSFFE